jgi:hypothetical protein
MRKWAGMNWCRPSTRLAIYLRDGLACVWCGASAEEATQLTLDHLVPHSKGGDNRPHNLVTACRLCNTSRNNRGVRPFARAVAGYLADRTEDDIVRHITNCRMRKLPRGEAQEMLKRRGTVKRCLEET